MSFKALERAQKDPEFAQQLQAFQASVFNAVVQSLPAADVGRAMTSESFRWEVKSIGNDVEERTFFLGKRPMGYVKMKLGSNDGVVFESGLTLPETPEELARRDPHSFAPGTKVLKAPKPQLKVVDGVLRRVWDVRQ